MRALVGSEGSTGAVKGARREILAKVRAERGTSSRSAEVMTVFTVLLVVSMGWLASDGNDDSSRCSFEAGGVRGNGISAGLKSVEAHFAARVGLGAAGDSEFILGQGDVRSGNPSAAGVLSGDEEGAAKLLRGGPESPREKQEK